MSVWTLKYFTPGDDPVTQTLAEWGAVACILELASCDLDTLTIGTRELMTDDPQWAVDATVELWQDATRRFFGRVVEAEPSAAGNGEGITYTIAGPWWYAQQFPFTQDWAIFGGSSTFAFPRALLFASSTTADVIAEAIAAVLAHSVPASGDTLVTLAAGTIDAAIKPPREKVTDQKCADVILKCMRFMPDAVFFFDYSGATGTAPIFHCRRAADLAEVDVPFGADDIVVARSKAQKLRYVRITLKVQAVEVGDDDLHTSTLPAVYPAAYGAGLNEHQLGGIDVALDYDAAAMTQADAQAICQSVYEAAQVIDWRGNATFTGDEVNMALRPGVRVNVTDGLAAWETMRALVQTATHDVLAASTEVTYGPPIALGPEDLAAMLRAWRGRVGFTANELAEQETGKSPTENFGFDKDSEATGKVVDFVEEGVARRYRIQATPA